MHIYRIIDANANRIREGLRVIEDISRFILNDKDLTDKIKKIRHEITFLTNNITKKSVFFRKIREDICKSSNLKSEFKREDINSLIYSNVHRAEEGIRVLEEISKLENRNVSRGFKKIRYEVYSIEQRFAQKINKSLNYSKYVIFETDYMKLKDVKKNTAEFIKNKINVLQFKDNRSMKIEALEKAVFLRNYCADYNITFVVNNHIDIAISSNADGLHFDDLNVLVKDIKNIVPDKVIGVSISSVSDAKKAEKEGADYILINNSYFNKENKNIDKLSLKSLKNIVANVKIPVVSYIESNKKYNKEILRYGVDGTAYKAP